MTKQTNRDNDDDDNNSKQRRRRRRSRRRWKKLWPASLAGCVYALWTCGAQHQCGRPSATKLLVPNCRPGRTVTYRCGAVSKIPYRGIGRARQNCRFVDGEGAVAKCARTILESVYRVCGSVDEYFVVSLLRRVCIYKKRSLSFVPRKSRVRVDSKKTKRIIRANTFRRPFREIIVCLPRATSCRLFWKRVRYYVLLTKSKIVND